MGDEGKDEDVVKFRIDRPRSSGISRWKKRKERKKETSAVKHKTAGNYRSGQPNNTSKKVKLGYITVRSKA